MAVEVVVVLLPVATGTVAVLDVYHVNTSEPVTVVACREVVALVEQNVAVPVGLASFALILTVDVLELVLATWSPPSVVLLGIV